MYGAYLKIQVWLETEHWAKKRSRCQRKLTLATEAINRAGGSSLSGCLRVNRKQRHACRADDVVSSARCGNIGNSKHDHRGQTV